MFQSGILKLQWHDFGTRPGIINHIRVRIEYLKVTISTKLVLAPFRREQKNPLDTPQMLLERSDVN